MRSQKDLSLLQKRLLKRIYGYNNIANIALSAKHSYRIQLLTFLTIDCLNYWGNFCRAYFLSCTLKPKRNNGSIITLSNASISTFSDAIDASMKKLRYRTWRRGTYTRRDEPLWHKPSTLIDSCTEIGCSNLSSIHLALSTGSAVFDDLPKFRNYFAHKNMQTAMVAKNLAPNYLISSSNDPCTILLSYPPASPKPLIVDFLDDIGIAVNLLCD